MWKGADLGLVDGKRPVAAVCGRLRRIRAVDQSRYVEAEQLYRQILADRRRVLGGDQPGTLATRYDLARLIVPKGQITK
jgi:hypothetical protein